MNENFNLELKEKLKEEFLKKILEYNHVTFAELMNFEGARGECEISAAPDYPNLIMWSGISLEASEALRELVNEKKIERQSCSSFTYLIDGSVLKIPVAKNLKNYKKPRWLPVAFCRPKDWVRPKDFPIHT